MAAGEAPAQAYEVFVQGVLEGSRLHALQERLAALCDGSPAKTPFDYIERVYNSRKIASEQERARAGRKMDKPMKHGPRREY